MSTRARAVQRRCAAALALASLAAIASPQRASPSDDPPAAQAAPAQEPVASTGYAQSPVQLVHNAPAAWAADGTPVLADHHHGLPWGWALFVLLAAALGGLRLRREWNRRAVLQARAEAAEKGLRELADGVPGAVWRSQRAPDGQSRYLYVSNRIHDLTGYTAEETHSRGPLHSFVVIHPEDRAGVLAAYDRMIASPGREDLSYRLLHKDGQYRWVQSSVSCRHERGGGMLFAGVLLDARRTRQLEAERDHALRLLRDIADGIPGSIWQFRQEPDGRMHYSFMSEGIRHITGRSPEETNALMQAKSFVSVHPDDQGLLRGLMQRLVEKGGLEEEIYRLSTKDGGWKWVRSAAAARREPDGTIVSNGITLDATRIREAEDALSLARAHLQDLIDSIPGAVWRIRRSKDGVFRFEFISEGIGAITGGTLEPNGDALRVFQKNVPDADFQRLRLALTESALSGQTVQVEFNSRHANGHELRLMARANIRIDDGDPVWTGVLIDLTERRQLERQLAAARSRYEEIATAFPGAIWQMRRAVNGEESFTYMSANIERLTGRPAAATRPFDST